jgi:hypothetical protein
MLNKKRFEMFSTVVLRVVYFALGAMTMFTAMVYGVI